MVKDTNMVVPCVEYFLALSFSPMTFLYPSTSPHNSFILIFPQSIHSHKLSTPQVLHTAENIFETILLPMPF